jgi:hypothetical protein
LLIIGKSGLAYLGAFGVLPQTGNRGVSPVNDPVGTEFGARIKKNIFAF